MAQNRGHLLTEQQNQQSMYIDRMNIGESFDVINGEDRTVADAVGRAKPQICEAIQCVVRAFERGGRLFYVGAGTSGRLGVLDAAECPPTFMTPPEMVQGIIAGGDHAIRRSIEGAEDRTDDAAKAIAQCEVTAKDVVMGIATGGTTPFVHAALAEAKRRGAKTIFFACVPEHAYEDHADISIRVLTGPEVITGSTRMKAGTATKMVLNMITTISMIRIGKVFGNLMVDLNRDACAKLQDRAIRIVQAATGTSRNEAKQLLRSGEDVKTAIVMHFKNADREEASRMLIEVDGCLDRIIECDDD
ncbi:MAG: N-acetylmuramic acid 6-phosphate etherase [Planctomycetes bacterium]|nr:N-acetylmuramic acid 6-phosphate etherase [Planctomycetota bacterium]